MRKRLSRAFANWSAFALLGLALFIGVGWAGQLSFLLQMFPDSAPAQPLDGVLLFFSGVAVLGIVSKHYRISRIMSALILVLTLVIFAEYVFETNWSIGNFISDPYILQETSFPGRPSPNGTAAFFLSSFVLFILSTTIRNRLESPILALTGVVVMAIGAAAFFGYITNVRSGYGWGLATRMSGITAVGVLLLGATVIALVWSSFSSLSKNIRELWRAIIHYSTAGVLVIALMSSALAILPFFDRLHVNEEQRIEQLADEKADAVDRYLEFVRSEVEQTESLIEQVDTQLVLNSSRALRGRATINRSGNVVATVGQKVPPELLPPLPDDRSVAISGPFEMNSELLLIAAMRGQGEGITHAYMVDTTRLQDLLRLSNGRLSSEARTYLVTYQDRKVRVFGFESGVLSEREGERLSQVSQYMRRTKGVPAELSHPILTSETPNFISFSPTDDGHLFVAIATDAKTVYRDVNLHLMEFVTGALILALLGSLGTYSLGKSLADRASLLHQAREQHEKEMERSLEEKEILIREIHHRVKNNLQVLSSLLRLQARSLKDRNLEEAFEESQHRIHSIALLHELLYRSENVSGISISEYTTKLCQKLVESFSRTDSVRLRVELNDIILPLERALPFGLIINEVVTNSLKHGFDQEGGEILFTLKNGESKDCTIVIADSGKGFDFDEALGNRSLGIQLINKLARQMDATIVQRSGKGTALGGTEYDLILSEKRKAA